MAAWLGPAGVWGLSLSRTLSLSGQVARTVASWTFSVQPRCTPRVGVYARSAPSWAFIGARQSTAAESWHHNASRRSSRSSRLYSTDLGPP